MRRGLLAVVLAAQALTASAATLYVWQSSPSPAPPYATWASAATNIQDAIDAAAVGDDIVVTNGIYATGGRGIPETFHTNRIIIDKSIVVRSVSGPLVTTIVGERKEGYAYVRCAYLETGATLSGFTLTNGFHRNGAGAFCESGAVLTNCRIVGNYALDSDGDGFGAGVYGGRIYNSVLAFNDSGFEGGAAEESTLFNCLVINNFTDVGGALSFCTAYNSVLASNVSNYAPAAEGSTLVNCTIVANRNRPGGTGAPATLQCTLTNCISYLNSDGPNFSPFCSLEFSCTTPLPTNGTGNITNEPAFVNAAAGDYKLRAGSPCIDTGTNLSASITNDLDGRPRPLDGNGDGQAAFDMGAYEYKLPLLVWPGSASPTPPYRTWATAAHTIQDAVDAAEAGDEIVVTNGVYATGGRVGVGSIITNRVAVTKPVTVRSVNGPVVTVIQGYQVPGTTNGDSAIRCAFLTNGAALVGFTLTNGATGVGGDAEINTDGGGVYCWDYGTMVSNCVLTGNSAGLGGGAYAGTLYHCTLSGNSAGAGGGAEGANLNNCLITGNSAGLDGGGAWFGTLNNCVLKGNSAGREGGGTWGANLNNCTVTGNSAGERGGGAVGAEPGIFFEPHVVTLNNCIVYSNDAPVGANYLDAPPSVPLAINYSCTTPLPTNGIGNITNEPAFVNAAAGDYRLRAGSPCIDTGTNLSAIIQYDLAGRPRPMDGNKDGISTFDMGAYEFVLVWPTSPGAVVMWGENADGQANVPAAAQSGVTAFAVGESHTVALKDDGSVLVWGSAFGSTDTNVPVAAHSGVIAIAAGESHTVALKNDGSVVAWGLNTSGQTTVPVAAQSGVTAIAAGYLHTVALKNDGSVVAWGENFAGATTVPVEAQSGVMAIAAGGLHTVALKSDGTVVAWGFNTNGQTTVPAGLSQVTAVAAGFSHTVALKNDGSVVAWGAGTNSFGSYRNRGQSIVPVVAESGVVAIAAGFNQSMALIRSPVPFDAGRSGNNLVLSWPTNAPGFTLQSTLDLAPPVIWVDVTNAPALLGAQWTVTNSFSGGAQFYRLRKL